MGSRPDIYAQGSVVNAIPSSHNATPGTDPRRCQNGWPSNDVSGVWRSSEHTVAGSERRLQPVNNAHHEFPPYTAEHRESG